MSPHETSIHDCQLTELPRIAFREGNITAIEGLKQIPFETKRVFYLYDIPAGTARGAHAHRHCQQFLIAASGSFEIQLDDGINSRSVRLNRPFQGLYIPAGIWSSQCNFSSGAVCLVLTSEAYDESDYLRSHDAFLHWKQGANGSRNALKKRQNLPFLDLSREIRPIRPDILSSLNRVVESGWFVLGQEVKAFEQEYARYIGSSHCIGTGNGLDALTLIFRAWIEMGELKAGDEVLVPANTYIASILSITENRLKPVLVEPHFDTLQIDLEQLKAVYTPRCKALLLVHLYGRNAWTPELADFCRQNKLKLVEDNAQAAGCMTLDGRHTGSLGDAAAHSFYPSKNLAALGDGGAITTSCPELAYVLRCLRNYGSSQKYTCLYQGINSRLDELQAAVLRARLPYLDSDNLQRRRLASLYVKHLKHHLIHLPKATLFETRRNRMSVENVWHLFPIYCERRDALLAYLDKNGIQAQVHYPIPPHRQACYPSLHGLSLPITERIHRDIISLPLSPALDEADVMRVVEVIRGWRP